MKVTTFKQDLTRSSDERRFTQPVPNLIDKGMFFVYNNRPGLETENEKLIITKEAKK